MSDISELVARLVVAGTPEELACDVVARAFIAGHMATDFRTAPVVGRGNSPRLRTDGAYTAPIATEGNRSK